MGFILARRQSASRADECDKYRCRQEEFKMLAATDPPDPKSSLPQYRTDVDTNKTDPDGSSYIIQKVKYN